MRDNELVVFYGMLLKKISNKYYCNGAFGRYIDELAKKYNVLFLVVPVITLNNEKYINDYEIKSTNIIFQEIPEYNSYFEALKKAKLIKETIKKHSSQWNSVVYIRWPVPFFKYVFNIASRKALPVCFHLVGDSKTVISEGTKYKGILKILAIKFAEYNEYIIKKLIKITPTLVNGSGLRRLYSQDNKFIKEICTSTFSKKEIESSIKEINKELIKILYVGYLRHEKGLQYLLEAVKLLRKENVNVYLTIIGEGDILVELKKVVIDLEIDKFVNFKGYIPLGETLFNEYKKHDIFVLPSISEGTPRVLLEAMCKGLAVIATNVGGIPYSVKNEYNGILVKPKDSKALANSILKVINDDDLRKYIITNGFEFAQKNTLENHVDEVFSFIKEKCLEYDVKYEFEDKTIDKVKRFLIISIPVHLIMLITGLLPNSEPANKTRGFLLKPFFKSAGKNLQVASGVILNRIDNISVGDNVYIAHNVWMNGSGRIYIENGVIIGPFSVLATTEHVIENGSVSNKRTLVAPIRIGQGSWLASHVVVTSGVNVGNGSLIAAGAVITKDVNAHSLYGGVPAKFIREIK
ncbi:MAG: glycosyltransferase [Firmicutes bacterium]|nr:glycosyltransferase [Bacillota bacterium]